MPIISRFFGIVIYMYYNDHNPPHFHARHGDAQAVYSIHDLTVLEGELPKRAHNRVVKWAQMHRDELMDDWTLTQNGQEPYRIPPLG